MGAPLDLLFPELDPVCKETADWPNRIRVHLRTYVTAVEPTAEIVSSVRAVVTRDREVLVVTTPNGRHLVPGGRIEAEESHDAALRRELVEETGWEVGDLHPIGFVHYRHLTPRPDDYPYPYPDSIQCVFTAEGTREVGQIHPDEWELAAEWVVIEHADQLNLPPVSLAFLSHVDRMKKP
tara:strand:- start:9228 stop:9767 length:540 start_codon:yes stop_codon:yes gene_type:complete